MERYRFLYVFAHLTLNALIGFRENFQRFGMKCQFDVDELLQGGFEIEDFALLETVDLLEKKSFDPRGIDGSVMMLTLGVTDCLTVSRIFILMEKERGILKDSKQTG